MARGEKVLVLRAPGEDASVLNRSGLGTLLFDLLTPAEVSGRANGLVNIGGLLCSRDKALIARGALARTLGAAGSQTATQNLVACVNRAGVEVVDTVLEQLAASDAVLASADRWLAGGYK